MYADKLTAKTRAGAFVHGALLGFALGVVLSLGVAMFLATR